MSFKQEIYQDINDNCDILLNLLKDETPANDTAAGRMIYQCRWLKDQVVANALRFPVNDYVHTLKHVSTERLLEYLASSPDRYGEEIGIYFYRLLKLVKGKLLLKPTYYPYTIRCIDTLLDLLQHPTRSLDQYERGLTHELLRIKQGLGDCSIESPLMYYLPDYPNFRKVYRIYESTLDDIAGAKWLTETIAEAIFEGVRPDSWVTPQDADRETANLRK